MVSVAGRRTGLSRVTLVGERRRVDMVLPAREPVGELLPDVLRLLGDEPAARPSLRRLVTPDGAVLAQDETLASAGVADGAVLRLVRQQETPAAPVVHDVTDEVAEDLDVRRWRWGDGTRVWTAGAAHVLLGLVAAVWASVWLGADAAAPWIVAAAVVAAAAGAGTAGFVSREPGTALVLLGGALGVFGAWTATDTAAARLAAVAAAVALALVLLGLCAGAGRGALVGAVAVAVTAGAWELALVWTDVPRAGVALGVVSVLALGLLPRLALTGAGLTRLDDQRSGGASVSRHRVDAALAATHRGLALATVVTAASAAVAGWVAVERYGYWTVAGAALTALVLFSRSRAYPLAVGVVALLGAGTVLAVRLLVLWAGGADAGGGAGGPGAVAGPLAGLAVVALVPLAVLVVRPPDHVRVRLRRLSNLAESVGVVLLVPVAIGAFGVYGRLLDTF
ncbi:type VII secretion integral membrane protein EccD [Streptomyces sp. TRM 70351]|uniref:type VII secretion integral membrane protein EccD n=1 Tax=Streptomyces sp. TRM 70351 TaxID=3116552 RepID=UPI002E7B14D0|nr:type VII secretion integral membrane protein EccD [Streptomyces sp. TRM 70351]MEE1930950.1 type VII secretion integral membrane protein EccD [Streptomyces sp. TRM 70351]